MVKLREWTRGGLLSREWKDDAAAPKAVLQIAHGMAEHSARYNEFATFLAEHGYAVYMEDHAGHGPNAKIKGFFAEKHGWLSVVNDIKSLMDEAKAANPGLPVFLMGHSMGSFLSRSYITRYADGLSGVVLSGTMGPNPALPLVKLICACYAVFRGKKTPAPALAKLTNDMNNAKFKSEGGDFGWLTTVKTEVAKYEADEFCGFPFTAGGFIDLFYGAGEINSHKWAPKVPKTLPIYLYSGEDDPVGDFGKGVRAVYDALKRFGVSDVELKLYKGGRHEMHNESNKTEVYNDVLAWLDKHIN
jgi:alpha-beta hydrolase superfamily lysophospholipase